ncbi:MAG: hypothetical protein ACLTTW_04215 [Coprobacter sp.]
MSPNIEAAIVIVMPIWINMMMLSKHLKGCKKAENDGFTCVFTKAAISGKTGDYKKALDFYQKIKDKYSQSMIGRDIDKYIERAKAQIK